MQMLKLPAYLALIFLAATDAPAKPVVSLTDQSGRSMDAEIITVADGKVSFIRKSDGKRFALPLATFNAETVARIGNQATVSESQHPQYLKDVVIEKRRSKKSGSYYMVTQTVGAKVTIKNPEPMKPAPGVSVKFLYLGEDRRKGDRYEILGTAEYSIQLAAGAADVREIEKITTTFDSDNKGTGNIGGLQYDGYVLIMSAASGEVLSHTSSNGKLAAAFRDSHTHVKTFLELKKGVRLDEKFKPTRS